jgi:ribonucleoside-diphosphate reductase alpha chain
VPIEGLVNKFTHQRFEPAGMTANRDIPIAKSLVDYIFRWMGMEFIPGYHEANAPKRTEPGEIKSSFSENSDDLNVSSAVNRFRQTAGPDRVESTPAADRPAMTPGLEDEQPWNDFAEPETSDAPVPATTRSPQPARPTRGPTSGDGQGMTAPRGTAAHGSGTASAAPAGRSRNGSSASMPAQSMAGLNASMRNNQEDAPACDSCGAITVRSGTCYKCVNCGSSMGCS